MPLAQLWGGGLVASIDGLRFVVPVATVYAGASPRYFGRRRGATWLNAINDRVAGIGAQVVPGTPRDSLVVLDVMLNPDNGRRPELVTSDTGGYSDMVFGLYRICGMQYAPRLADLSDTRFWRLDPAADYGPLDGPARSRVRPEKITTHWEQMLRIAGSLVTGQVRAYDLIRALGRDGKPHPARASVRRVRADRQDAALARRDRPRRGHLPARPERAAERHRVPAPAGPQAVLRPARRTAPALPGRPGRPTRRARPGPQRRRAVEHHLPARRAEAARRRPPGRRRRCHPAVPARRHLDQRPRRLRLHPAPPRRAAATAGPPPRRPKTSSDPDRAGRPGARGCRYKGAATRTLSLVRHAVVPGPPAGPGTIRVAAQDGRVSGCGRSG